MFTIELLNSRVHVHPYSNVIAQKKEISIRTDYTKLQHGRVNEWESILGRLDAVADEIKRALGRVTSIEEPGVKSGLPALQKISSRAAL